MPTILEVPADDAKIYFMEVANYINFDLPKYFDFSELLRKVDHHMGTRHLHEFFSRPQGAVSSRILNPKDVEGVNYKLIGNKDGEFAWRPFEVIHPVLYVSLVNEITETNNWKTILDRFGEFKDSAVTCASIPFLSEDKEKHKAHQIRLWWENIELEGIRLSLKYNCVYDVDISDCYGSIYTHSISWALHSKSVMKNGNNRTSSDYVGNRIDWLIQKMRHGQTNGIPQGSTVMDFIAEMLLGYIDLLLTQQLDKLGFQREDYSIIRFRDDYKIFTNNPVTGRSIVKELSSVLSDHGLKLNTLKTKLSTDPVTSSIKPDKLYELFVPNNKMTLSKRLIQIYKCSEIYPNSGIVTRQLNNFYGNLRRVSKLSDYDNPLVMIGIVVNLAINNPKSYQWSMAILSQLLSFCDPQDRLQLINDIRIKFTAIPNTGILDIWLQRISLTYDSSIIYKENLTRIAAGHYHTNIIWKSEWLNESLRDIVTNTSIVKSADLTELSRVISPQEVALFSFPEY